MPEGKLEAIAKAAIGEVAKQAVGPLLRQVAMWAVPVVGFGAVSQWTLFQFASEWAKGHPFRAAMVGVGATALAGALSFRGFRRRFAAIEDKVERLRMSHSVPAASLALVGETHTQRGWSVDELRLRMERPLYRTDGQFLAELWFYSPVPFPPNSKLKTLLVEARSLGNVLGQYRYTGPSMVLVGRDVRIGKAFVPIKHDVFPAYTRGAAASRAGHWEVEIDVRVNFELAVPGLSDSGPYDLQASSQFCGVRDSFSPVELHGALPKDLT